MIQWLHFKSIRKTTIDHGIFIKVLYDGTVYFRTVFTDGVINSNNNNTAFTELRRVFEKAIEIKVQEGYFLKSLNFRFFQSPLGFGIYHTDHIIGLLNEWFLTETFSNVYAPFRTDSICEKVLIAALPLTVNALIKAEM